MGWRGLQAWGIKSFLTPLGVFWTFIGGGSIFFTFLTELLVGDSVIADSVLQRAFAASIGKFRSFSALKSKHI